MLLRNSWRIPLQIALDAPNILSPKVPGGRINADSGLQQPNSVLLFFVNLFLGFVQRSYSTICRDQCCDDICVCVDIAPRRKEKNALGLRRRIAHDRLLGILKIFRKLARIPTSTPNRAYVHLEFFPLESKHVDLDKID